MKDAFGEYRRLAGGGLGMSSLWMGGDHLLFIRGSGFILPFSEEYKRFRYADIQGIVTARTAGWFWGALAYLCGFAAAAGIAFAMLFFREPGDNSLLAATLALPLPIAALMLILAIRHLVLGPRCICEIQTGVKRERLTPVNRLHLAREVLDQLSPRIREAQAGLLPESTEPTAVKAWIVEPLRVPAIASFTFPAVLLAGLSFVLLFFLPSLALAGSAVLLTFVSSALLLISLVKSVRVPCPGEIRKTLWASLVALLIFFAVAGVYYIDQAISDPTVTLDILGPFEAFAQVKERANPAFTLLLGAAGSILALTGGLGIASILRWRERPTMKQGTIADPTLFDRQ